MKTEQATIRAEKFFGTDGVRGAFGDFPLDRETVHRLGRQLGRQLTSSGESARVVLGGDTRDSTSVLCAWLRAGLEEGASTPVEIFFLGTVPTPAVAHAVRRYTANCGLAVSASHNPHPDNGIKLIDSEGYKWTPEAETSLAQGLLADETPAPLTEPSTPPLNAKAVETYLRSLHGSLRGDRPLAGSRIALDMANGSASAYAQEIFEGLGAQVFASHDAPDGSNINQDCGSTHPEALSLLTREQGADLGIAFDGDADRAILIDEKGQVRDGDAMLFLWARHLNEIGELPGDAIVATSMSNLGLEIALRRYGIAVERCDVGDREVVAMLRRKGLILGGEQSGHIVHLGLSTTGDGLLTALQIAAIRQAAGQPMSTLLAGLERCPQLLLNVPVRRKIPFEQMPAVTAAADQVAETLGQDGRLVLRYSGTESLARIMVEGPEQGQIESMAQGIAQEIIKSIEAQLG